MINHQENLPVIFSHKMSLNSGPETLYKAASINPCVAKVKRLIKKSRNRKQTYDHTIMQHPCIMHLIM